MQTGNTPSYQRAVNPIRFSGNYQGITTVSPSTVLKQLAEAVDNSKPNAKSKPTVDVFVARNLDGEGMDVIVQPASELFPWSPSKNVEFVEQYFQAWVERYNSRHQDQVSWQGKSNDIPDSKHRDKYGFLSLAEALQNSDQFSGGTIRYASDLSKKSDTETTSEHPYDPKKLKANGKKRMEQRLQKQRRMQKEFSAIDGWDPVTS
jgi:hypothetical protein